MARSARTASGALGGGSLSILRRAARDPDAALLLKRERLSLRSLQLVIKNSAAIHTIAELLFTRGEFGDVDMPASIIIKRHLREHGVTAQSAV